MFRDHARAGRIRPEGFEEGNVHTYEGPVSLRLRIDDDSGFHLEVDARSPVALIGIAFDGDRLTAMAREVVGTSDTRGASMLRLTLTHRGDELRGMTTALGSGGGVFPLALSHWTVLKRQGSGD